MEGRRGKRNGARRNTDHKGQTGIGGRSGVAKWRGARLRGCCFPASATRDAWLAGEISDGFNGRVALDQAGRGEEQERGGVVAGTSLLSRVPTIEEFETRQRALKSEKESGGGIFKIPQKTQEN